METLALISVGKSLFFGISVLASMMVVLAAERPGDAGERLSVRTSKAYESVVADLKFAITNRNYRITGENDIGAALGLRHGRPFNSSTVVHFCNLDIARAILERAPDFLLHMPCKISVYQAGDETVVETWLLPVDPRIADIAVKVNELLRGIITEAAR